MFRILLIIIIFSTLLNCTDSHKDRTPVGYVAQDFSLKGLSSTKAYSFTSIGESCPANKRCSAVYYSGAFGNDTYTGIAADSRQSGGTTDFNIIVYKNSSQSYYTIKIMHNHILYINSTVDPSNLAITNTSAGIFTLTFNSSISVGTKTITTADTIVAQSQ